ncbi:MAG: lysozyme [Pseudomonadota bacterium]
MRRLCSILFCILLSTNLMVSLAQDAQLDAVDKLAIPLLVEFEGFSDEVYICSGGKKTIGYGFTGAFGCGEIDLLDQPITEEHALSLLYCDLRVARDIVKKHVRVALTPNQEAALTVWVFNLGEANLATSTMLRKLNSHDFRGAAEALEWWNKARDPNTGSLLELKGLTRRRAAERALFERLS